MDRKIGHYSFLAGILIALLAALITDFLPENTTTLILVVLGLIVGFLNVTAKETIEFLIAAIALMAAGAANLTVIPGVGVYLQGILKFILVFVAPAAVVVAFKAIYAMAER